jgi:hypothetical protein
MPQVSNELGSQYWEASATGPVVQADLTNWSGLPAVPATILAAGNYTSNVLYSDGFRTIAAGVTSSQAGAISIQRYIDRAGLVPQGAAVSSTLVAATPNVVNISDGLACQSFKVVITNTGGSTANITNFGLLLNAY